MRVHLANGSLRLMFAGYCNIIVRVLNGEGGPGSSVGIATELRAGRSRIESRWGRDFPPVQTGPGAHPASCTMGTESFPGVKRKIDKLEASCPCGVPPPPPFFLFILLP